jgi:hypothetical protein
MWNALMFSFGIRYLVGDKLFDTLWPLQSWDELMNEVNTSGNLLFPLYDDPTVT